MKRIKTLIVDDEAGSREVLLSLLEKYFPEVEVLGEAKNVEEAFEQIQSKSPELVFLDIQMPRATGFDLLKKFEQVPFEVVFITSFDKYAINAIKFSALDYLLKPVELEDLGNAIKKAINSIESKTNNKNLIINLLLNLDKDSNEKKIAIHSGEKVKFLSELSIIYVEGDGRYCHVTLTNGEVYITAKNLKDFEDYFESTNSFVRISRDFIINLRHVKDYTKREPCIIQMTNGKSFEISRRKKTEVLEKLKN